MTINAAGILFHTPAKKVLYLKRGPGGDYPLFWCFPGGKMEGDETAIDAAKRETIEEIGFLPEGNQTLWTRSHSEGLGDILTPEGELLPGEAKAGEIVDFTTFRQLVAQEFVPQLEGEHIGWSWAPIDQPPEPLHPGCKVALDKFGMTELGVAESIRDGALTSPQQYENIWLFDIRISGTGTSYRKALDEYVYRAPENYLSDEFLARCNGLPVIIQHPPTDVLNSKEFAQRVIGTVLLPYIKGDEVWGIAKIYDDMAAKEMCETQLSTSPAVLFRDIDVNTKLTMEDGSLLLIEGKPSLLDHIAICGVGVWDKGGDPTGVISVDAEEVRTDSVDPVKNPTFWSDNATHKKLDQALGLSRNLAITAMTMKK